MKLPAFEISNMKFPHWIFPASFLGLVKYPALDGRIYTLGVIAALWTYQDFFYEKNLTTKIVRYSLRALALAAMIASIFQST